MRSQKSDNCGSCIVHNIDLAVIRNFVAVVETGSLKLAAKKAGRTTGDLSYQIGQLEAALGQKLFVRNGKGMAPSQEGDQFLVKARFLIHVYDQTLDNKNSKPLPALDKKFCQKKAERKDDLVGSDANQIDSFEDKLKTQLYKDGFSMWQSYRTDGREPSLDDLI